MTGCVALVLILGFGGVAEVELEGTGESDGDGFSVGNVNVGNISDVDVDADSDGTSEGLFDVDVKAVLYGVTYEIEVGIGETVPEPLDFDLNLGGLRYVVALELEVIPNSWAGASKSQAVPPFGFGLSEDEGEGCV